MYPLKGETGELILKRGFSMGKSEYMIDVGKADE